MEIPSRRPEPGYIIVMGMTGSGKTTFISRLTGPHADVGVGNTLSSSTIDTTCYPIPSPTAHRPLFLIDTPGFDDTTRSGTSILQTIADQLVALHRARRPILGIIVLHRITDVRLAGSAIKTFRVLQRLCGPENYDRVVLATTMWTDASFTPDGREAAMARQRRLREYWGREDMFQGRSVVMRHAQDTVGSAWRVVNAVMALAEERGAGEYRPLGIQVKIGERGLALEETEAGRFVLGVLVEARRRQVGEGRELERKVEEGTMVLRSRRVSPSPDRVDQPQKWFVSLWTSLRSGRREGCGGFRGWGLGQKQ